MTDPNTERPKYALPENERRFLVEPQNCPRLDPATARRIEDRYFPDTRLRLRKITRAAAPPIYKLCRKYESNDALTNLYLTETEYRLLRALSGDDIAKTRYTHDGFAVDVFEAPHAGLIIAEIEAPTRAALIAITPPGWVAREVTTDPNLTGAALAKRPPL